MQDGLTLKEKNKNFFDHTQDFSMKSKTEMSASARSIDSWLNNIKMNRVVMVTTELSGNQETARLQLTDDWLMLMKEEVAYTYSPIDKIDPEVLTKERVVQIRREKIGGLGLSVKGGSEHNLPILISRIFKDQAADRTGQLFVGDAILKVNSTKLEQCQHDEAVQVLKRAGEVATLTVKYFRPASIFLAAQRRSAAQHGPRERRAGSSSEATEEVYTQPEKQWTELLNMHMLCAYITKYVPGTDEPRSCGFEVSSLEGACTGALYVDDTQTLGEWIQAIMDSISRTNFRFIEMFNKTLVIEQHLHHMCWVCERCNPNTKHAWCSRFLTFRGSDVSLYNIPPVKDKNWRHFLNSYKIYECMFRILKNDELEDDRTYCFVLETSAGSIHYLSVETRQELLKLEKAWHWANYMAVKQLKCKTYGCTWRGKMAGITLDHDKGFALYDQERKCYVWSYKFSQLKGSSDDGNGLIKLHFINDNATAIENREIECTNMLTILFAIQAFLCAKLASVDPKFLSFT